MTTRRRFWVEVTPRFATPTCPAAQPMSPSSTGSPSSRTPRLTELAVAMDLEGAELDAELTSVRQQRSTLAAYEAGLIERKATLGAAHPLPFLPGTRTDLRARPATTIDATTTSATAICRDTNLSTGADTAPDPAWQAADDFLPDEVAVLLNMSVPSTRHLVDHALTLVRQLPAVWHALADQRIDETRAKVIVTALGYQATSHGGPVPNGVVDDVAALGVEWAARGCAPTTLRERLDAALLAADPAAADRRRELRTRTANVTATGTGDSLAELKATQLNAADAKLVRAQIDAYAKKIKTDGDPRPIGEIRVSVLVALVTRPWEQVDPAIAHVTINADLTDLLLPDLIASAGDQPPEGEAAGGRSDDEETLDRSDNGPPRTERPDNDDAADIEDDPIGTEDPAGYGQRDEASTRSVAYAPDDSRDTPGDEPTAPHSAAPETVAPPTTTPAPATPGPAAPERATPESAAPEPSGNHDAHDLNTPVGTRTIGPPPDGSRAGHVGGLPVTPAAVRALLQRIDALGLTHPGNGTLVYTITGPGGRVLAVATPDELLAAAAAGRGLGPPPPAFGYTPTAAQYRYLRARDRHCRFPGCRQVAMACDADHVTPYNRNNPSRGGPTCITNLTLLCRHHHRLKTHATGWCFRLDPDGTLHVTTPGGVTRTTRPPAIDQILDLMTEPPSPYNPAEDPPPF